MSWLSLFSATAKNSPPCGVHELATRAGTLKRFVHPLAGPLPLDCQILTSTNIVERLVVFTASPGSEPAERLKLLSVVGSLTSSLARPPRANHPAPGGCTGATPPAQKSLEAPWAAFSATTRR
jgi:MmyB-like transcription regulator ligand binding domain